MDNHPHAQVRYGERENEPVGGGVESRPGESQVYDKRISSAREHSGQPAQDNVPSQVGQAAGGRRVDKT